MGTRKQRYGLRKLSIGAVSCLLGSVIYFGAGMTVNAEEVQPTKEETGDASDIAETSADPILDESTPAEEDPTLNVAEDDLATEYDEYDINNTWAKDDSFDVMGAGAMTKYYYRDQAHKQASTTVTREDGTEVTVTAKIKSTNGAYEYSSYFFNGGTMANAKGDGEPYAGKTAANQIPALGVILYSPGQEAFGLTGSDYINFEGEIEIAEMTLTFSEEVTNPILDLSGVGGYAMVQQDYWHQPQSGQQYTSIDQLKDKFYRGSFMSTKFVSLTDGVTFTKVVEGKNLTIKDGALEIADKNANNSGNSANVYGVPSQPSGTGSVQLTGTFREVKLRLIGQFTPMSRFEGDGRYSEDDGMGVKDGINGWNYSGKEKFTIGDNQEFEDSNIMTPSGPQSGRNSTLGADEDSFMVNGRDPNADAWRFAIRLEKTGNVLIDYVDEYGNSIKKQVVDMPEGSALETPYDTQQNDNEYPYEIKVGEKTYRRVEAGEYKVGTVAADGHLVETTTNWGKDEPTGVVEQGTKKITYVYKEVKGDVVVHYIDEDGNTIKDDVQDTPLVPTGTNYDTTDNKPKVIKFNGKEYELVPTKTIGKENGKVVEGTTHITYVYKLKKGDVVVHYVDEEGNPIKEDVVDTPPSPTGTEYDTTDNKPTIITYNGKKYELVPIKTVGNENGKVVEGTTHITYVYRLVPEQPPVVTPPTPTPKPAPIPIPTPVQTGMGSAVASSMATMLTSLGAMVAFKKKEKE